MTKKLSKQAEKSFDVPKKNMIRNKVIEFINRYPIKTILTLESPEFIFSKGLPNKKIYVFENNKISYEQMEKDKPKNVVLFYGDVSKFSEIDMNIDCIYLDFCKTFFSVQDIIYELKDKIKNCRLFIVTFCVVWRGHNKVEINGDYQFDLINRLQNLTEINLKVLYGKKYNNQMATIIFENVN